MKNLLLILLTGLFFSCDAYSGEEKLASTKTNPSMENNFFDFKMKAINGEEIDFSKYKGKKILVVNVASECGYTPQYEDLQTLHVTYGDKITVLGFPANNFGSQEPGADDEIARFCKKNYGVDFQMFSKIDVIGKNQHPLFQWLAKETGKEPNWNFCKYLIDENGEVMDFFPSPVNPLDHEVVDRLK